ncbi:hypothetical protein ACFL6S_12150 [Candidatus Poribacteria bacterium]
MEKDVPISQVVKISPAYATEVNLKDDFNDPEANRRKLIGYIPTKSSRVALESVRSGLYPTSQQRVHLITGTYGTGKSHFGLVVANLISRDIDSPDFESLFSKLRERDKELANSIQIFLRDSKRFLLVLPELSGGPEGFHHSLLIALNEALAREDIEFRPKTHFTVALDRIEDWKTQSTDEAFPKLEKELERRGHTVDQLIDGLRTCKEDFYKLFEQVHRVVAYGVSFEPMKQSELREVLAETIKYLRDSGQWNGIFIIYDEFGTYISNIANDPESFEAKKIQNFAEFCKRTGEEQCHFMVIAHQTIADYASGKRSQAEWQKIYGRFISGEHTLSTSGSEHEMEEMLATIISQQKESPLWTEHIEHSAAFDILADQVEERNLYPGKPREWIEDTLLHGTYPLHPYTAFVLPWLSDRVGQSHRTLFTFLGDDREDCLDHFIQNSPVLTSEGSLDLYTLDRLINYFEDAIPRNDEYKNIVQSRNVALSVVGTNLQAVRIINVVTALMILGNPSLPPTKEIIAEALNVPQSEHQKIYNLLNELAEQKEVLRYRSSRDHYELPRGSGDVSPKEAIRREHQRLLEIGFDWRELVSQKFPPEPITAREYIQEHFVRRQAHCIYIAPNQLSNPQLFLNKIESWYQPNRGKYEGDILLLYVIPDSQAELANAQNYIDSVEDLRHPQLVIAIPKSPLTLSEKVLDLKAAENLKVRTDESGQQIDPNELKTFIEDVMAQVKEQMDILVQAKNLNWYHNGNVGNNLAFAGEYISQIMSQVFPKTPNVKEDAIANPITGRDSRRTDRKHAMSILLETKGPFSIAKIDGSAHDRILRACVRDTEIAENVGDQGRAEEFEMRDDPPKGSVLAEIWEFLRNTILTQQIVPMEEIICPLLKPPYGLSSQLIEILLAAFLRKRKDECIFSQKKPLSFMMITVETLTDLVRNPVNHNLVYIELTNSEKSYLNQITGLFHGGEPFEGIGLWESAKSALLEWLNSLPKITRSTASSISQNCRAFVELLQEAQRQEIQSAEQAKENLKQHLPEALGLAPLNLQSQEDQYNAVLQELRQIRDGLEGRAQAVENGLIERLSLLFKSTGKTHPELDNALKAWYNDTLTDIQRLHNFSRDEAQLMKAAKTEGDVIKRVCRQLPDDMGIGDYLDWEDDKTTEFVLRVKVAKLVIQDYNESLEVQISSQGQSNTPIEAAMRRVRDLFVDLNLTASEREQVLWTLLEELDKSDND